MTKRTLLLIDGSSLAFRAFFSILDIERFKNQAGLHTNALYTFNRMLDNVLAQFQPSHVLVAFDKAGPTFRTAQFPDYKGGRSKAPSEFREQMPYFSVLLDAYGIKHYALEQYEADDIIGTLARQADQADEVIILSGDKDLTQLADEHTSVYITRKGVSDLEAYTPASIQAKWGISPQQIIDMKGLMGDSSDNYPGISRIGEKTALKLLHQFGSLEAMYQRLDELKPSKMKENIINDEANAFLSKKLATIVTDAPLEISIADLALGDKDLDLLKEFYQQMEFNTFLANLGQAGELASEKAKPVSQMTYTHLKEVSLENLPDQAVVYLETLIPNYHEAEVVGVAWADIKGECVYTTSGDWVLSHKDFQAWLASANHSKIAYDLKRDLVLCQRYGIDLNGVTFDVNLATYLVDLSQANTFKGIASLIQDAGYLQSDEEVYGKGAKLSVPESPSILDQHLANKVGLLARAIQPLTDQLADLGMTQLYSEIELPLASVLAEMEIQGIQVNADLLGQMNEDLLAQLAEMEEKIQALAGSPFNLNSPKQLGEVLFEQLGLPAIKKTKTGYSTAADVLEKLKKYHPIVQLLLDYRQLAKLQGTYLAGLPRFIHEDGKIHTRFDQTLTQTGRLSSSDPNLQNIPIRMEAGRRIRQAFVPSQPNWVLFGADYSQIELRVLAHVCGDAHMRQAFIEGEDIHAATARRVFGLAETAEVSSDYRRQAKAVNFGIVYGISDYGLAQNLDISRKEAKQFIETYFEKYPGVANFMEEIVAQAKQDGYVTTLCHRRRNLPDIHAANFNVRSFAERTAINSPIQGTAADIIKIAMVKLAEALKGKQLAARMLLQVHDELILEAPADEIAILEDLVPEVMEAAIQLAVPLKVDANKGHNWYELK